MCSAVDNSIYISSKKCRFFQLFYLIPKCLYFTSQTSFSSPLQGKLVHFIFSRNTIPFFAKNHANARRIKLSSPANKPSLHDTFTDTIHFMISYNYISYHALT